MFLSFVNCSWLSDPAFRITSFKTRYSYSIYAVVPYAKEAADNTQKIADRCHVTLEFGNYQIPKYAPPEGYDSAWTFLDALCEKGFKEKYTDNPAYDETQCAKIHDDMEYELGIIQKMGFVEYARAEEYFYPKLAQMGPKNLPRPPPKLFIRMRKLSEVLSKADALKKWAEEVYTYAQNEAVVNHKEWPGYKLVLGRSNRKYTDEEDVAEAAQKAGYTDIFKKSLIGITDMERLMGKKKFNEILGSLVYKPDGKVTLVPDSDKREAVKTATAEADFKED